MGRTGVMSIVGQMTKICLNEKSKVLRELARKEEITGIDTDPETKAKLIYSYKRKALKDRMNEEKETLEILKEIGYWEMLDSFGLDVGIAENKKVEGNWWFITFRPHIDDLRWNDFKQTTLDTMSRSMFIQWFGVFEQRGESTEELGKGFHWHCLAELTPTYNNIKRTVKDLKSSWNLYHGKMVPEAFVEVNKLKWDNEPHIKYLYMTGHKKETSKHIAMKLDPIWRTENNIEQSYQSKSWKGEPATKSMAPVPDNSNVI